MNQRITTHHSASREGIKSDPIDLKQARGRRSRGKRKTSDLFWRSDGTNQERKGETVGQETTSSSDTRSQFGKPANESSQLNPSESTQFNCLRFPPSFPFADDGDAAYLLFSNHIELIWAKLCGRAKRTNHVGLYVCVGRNHRQFVGFIN